MSWKIDIGTMNRIILSSLKKKIVSLHSWLYQLQSTHNLEKHRSKTEKRQKNKSGTGKPIYVQILPLFLLWHNLSSNFIKLFEE